MAVNSEEFMTQWQAAKNGLTIYNSDKPCAHGHGRQRYMTTGQCVVCTKLRAKARQEKLKALRDAARSGVL